MSDIINIIPNLRDNWEKPLTLFLTIVLIISLWFGGCKLFLDDKLSLTNPIHLLPAVLIIAIVIYWLYSTNRVFVSTSDKLVILVAVAIENDDYIKKAKHFFATAIKKIHSDRRVKFISLKLLPINSLINKEELVAYLDKNHNAQTLIWFNVNGGKQNNIEAIHVDDIVICGQFHDNNLRLLNGELNIIKDVSLRNAFKDWKYIDSEGLSDNIKIKDNLTDIILYYSGIYLIYQGRLIESLTTLKMLYNAEDRIVQRTQADIDRTELTIQPKNLLAGRLATILATLYIETATRLYYSKSVEEAVKLLKEAETLLGPIRERYHLYTNLARLLYEAGDMEASVSYTERMKAILGESHEVLLNQGFYCILNNDVQGFIQNYSKLSPRSATRVNHVTVRAFLDEEKRKFPERGLLFDFADAIITQYYIDQKEGAILLSEILKEIAHNNEYKDLRFLGHKILRITMRKALRKKKSFR